MHSQSNQSALVKPVSFDFILFSELEQQDNKFVIDQQTRRNYLHHKPVE